jgi:metallophosphoesterase (TIGR00282 family)
VRLLFIGDIVGRPGRAAVRERLAEVIQREGITFVVANGENAAGGMGITADTGKELLALGVHVVTTGNHIWRQKEALTFLQQEPRVLRPANYPPGAPGAGAGVFAASDNELVGVVNLVGRTFMEPVDCPFRAADREIESLRGKTKAIVVDIHGEATSEKVAMGWYLDGRVSAVIGTHTHIQTADERVLPKGTAYITDAGMTGPRDSILGVKAEAVIARFLTGLPHRFELAAGPVVLDAVVVEVDPTTGGARSIRRMVELIETTGEGAPPGRRVRPGEGSGPS